MAEPRATGPREPDAAASELDAGSAAEFLFALRWLAEPALSPAGDRVAYTETRLDRAGDRMVSRVGVVGTGGIDTGGIDTGGIDTGGGATRWLAEGHTPRWSPDGRELAVACGGELWLVEVDSGVQRELVAGAGVVSEPVWSPDGRSIAYARTVLEPAPEGAPVDGLPGLFLRRRTVVVVDLAGRPPWTVPGDAYHPRWSPSGGRLAYLTAGTGRWPALCWVDALEPGTPALAGGEAGPVRGFAWSPDGEYLAYLGHRHGDATDVNLRLWLVSGLTTGRPASRELSEGWRLGLGNPVRGDDSRGTGEAPVVWSAVTGRIYVEVADGGRGPLAWFAPAAGGTESGLLFVGDHVCLAPSVGSGRLAYVRTDVDSPGNIVVAAESSGAGQVRLTDANGWLAGRTAPTTLVPVTAPDGRPIEAWLTAAPGTSARPLLVNVHGGPHGAVGWRFTGETQRLAAQGYAVLSLNPRGSQGYGEAYATAIRGGWGGTDWSDVCAAVDAATGLSTVDSRRVAIWGVSYGGFMAQWAITRTDRFAAAVSENGISDFSDWSGTGRFQEASPLAQADRVSTPLLLLHAEDDQVCPVAQSERAAAALRLLGRSVELVRIPGEGHLMNLVGRPTSRLRRAGALDLFLAQHLLPARHHFPPPLPVPAARLGAVPDEGLAP